GVETTYARNGVVPFDRCPGRFQPRGDIVEIAGRERRMCLPRRTEVRLDPEVELVFADLEPEATASGQRRRLRQLFPTEHAAIERPALRLAAGRDGELDVVQAHQALKQGRPEAALS